MLDKKYEKLVKEILQASIISNLSLSTTAAACTNKSSMTQLSLAGQNLISLFLAKHNE